MRLLLRFEDYTDPDLPYTMPHPRARSAGMMGQFTVQPESQPSGRPATDSLQALAMRNHSMKASDLLAPRWKSKASSISSRFRAKKPRSSGVTADLVDPSDRCRHEQGQGSWRQPMDVLPVKPAYALPRWDQGRQTSRRPMPLRRFPSGHDNRPKPIKVSKQAQFQIVDVVSHHSLRRRSRS